MVAGRRVRDSLVRSRGELNVMQAQRRVRLVSTACLKQKTSHWWNILAFTTHTQAKSVKLKPVDACQAPMLGPGQSVAGLVDQTYAFAASGNPKLLFFLS